MRKHESGFAILGAKKCHRSCLSTIVGARTTNQALKKDKQASKCARNPGAVTDQGNLSVRLRSGRSDWKLVEFVTNLKLVGFVGFVTKLQTPWSGCRPRPA